MTLAEDLKKYKIKTLQSLEAIRRASILELFSLVVDATPVDKGRLRGNWQTTVNSPNYAIIDRFDAGGGLTKAEILANLGALGDVVYMTNNLPYAARIEYEGYSAQAKPGMMRVNAARWQEIVKAKAEAYA